MAIKKSELEEGLINNKSGEAFSDQEKLTHQTELKESLEKGGPTKDRIEHDRIRKEIENIDLDDSLKLQAQSHANDFKSLEDTKKIERLLQTAKIKGVVFAVNVAKKMNDPYVLDALHDALAKDGYYKKFMK